MLTGLTIRGPEGVAEIQALVELQKRIWGFPDIEAVPVSELMSIHAGGGYVRQAELDGVGLVGFAYGYWTLIDGRPELYSRMLAVLPEHRGQGIGVALKLDQREWTLARGADRARWTCDPLMASNGRLNFGLLGCECVTYRNNFYGERDNEIQRLLPTDRLLVEWPLAKPATVARLRQRTAPPALADAVGEHPAWVRA